MRKAKAEGASGVKLADIVPIGASVEVSYEERDGQRYAPEEGMSQCGAHVANRITAGD